MSAGILCQEQLRKLFAPECGPARIVRPSGDHWEPLVNASSVDLPLGDECWEMKGSCRAGRNLNVDDIIAKYTIPGSKHKVEGEMTLQKGKVYLFKVDCRLDLGETRIQGKSTARSSIGRLDTLVRLLVDKSPSFDRVTEEYRGLLHVEVTPITFDLLVRPGTCLSQLRLFRGSEHLISLSREALPFEDDCPVVDSAGNLLIDNNIEGTSLHEVIYPFCLDLSPDPVAKCAGFVAKKKEDLPPVAIDPDREAHYDPKEYWDPVQAADDAITLDLNRLYILRSKERLRLPQHLALECQAYTETMGEWRIEYAGFAHPFFGRTRKSGSPLMFEVRGHNIPTILTDGIPLGNVVFKRMSSPAEKPKKSRHYENQELKLSGCFRDWY